MINKWTGKLSATEVFTKSLNILSNNIMDIFKISLIFYIIPSLLIVTISAFLGVNTLSFNVLSNFSNNIKYLFSNSLIFLWIPISILLCLIPILGNFAIVKLINSKLKDEKTIWYECIKYAFSKTGSALLLILITLVISTIWTFTIVLFITIVCIFTFFRGLPIAIITILALTAILFIFLQFIIQSIVNEDLGVLAAIKHSVNLVKIRFWNAFGKIALLKLVCFLFNAGLTMFAIIPFVGIILSTLITLCLTIFQHIAVTIIFNDYEQDPNKLEFKI
ncbi:hypothetical protein [Clostridium tarantellae]|uniref:DUF975 family protein n=1 Tax=Clostridium tarantellae TaxID=39493 RepID=A0A6I1MNL9_9CLOT|nr:hypothetical protein [Clostridium tarantellae]MPQ44560.1 hypothetical protein [Clostridium tarantellae]